MTDHPTCAKCGQPHTTARGGPACTGHISSGDRKGQPCSNPPLTGLDVCRYHGGAARHARAAGTRRKAEQDAARAVQTLGLPLDVSPTEALLEEVRWTAGHVHWLRQRVQELGDRDWDPADVEHEPHPLVWGTTKTKTGGDDYGTTQEAKPSIWYVLYERERQHLVQVCAAALKAGVEERRVRLAEQQGDLVATAIRRILDALGLTPEQQALVGTVVPRELRLIAGGAA